MPITEPSGESITSPKIINEALARRFVSQGGRGYMALGVYDGKTPVDADAGTLALTVWFDDPSTAAPGADPRGTQIITVAAADITRVDVGKYSYDIGPQFTANRGVLTAQWTYQLAGQVFTFLDHMQILDQMPLYERLNDQERYVVEQVSWMLGDLFDSTDGGPWLKENFQTHFDYERLAQMQLLAVQRLNFIGYPMTHWSVGNPQMSSVDPNFAPLAVFGTYLETVRHLRDSYVEIPLFQQMNVTYTDRRDYMGRWNQIYQQDWPDYQRMVKLAKRKLLNLGHGSLLVAGGIYGGSSLGVFVPGSYASAVRSWRFYPALSAITFPAMSITK